MQTEEAAREAERRQAALSTTAIQFIGDNVGAMLSKIKGQLSLEDHVAKPIPKEGMKVSMSVAQAQRNRGQIPLMTSPQPVTLTAAMKPEAKKKSPDDNKLASATTAPNLLQSAVQVVFPALAAALGAPSPSDPQPSTPMGGESPLRLEFGVLRLETESASTPKTPVSTLSAESPRRFLPATPPRHSAAADTVIATPESKKPAATTKAIVLHSSPHPAGGGPITPSAAEQTGALEAVLPTEPGWRSAPLMQLARAEAAESARKKSAATSIARAWRDSEQRAYQARAQEVSRMVSIMVSRMVSRLV